MFHRTGDPVLDHGDFAAVRPHMGALTADGIHADVDAALAYIEGAGFPAEVAGIVGFCMGGSVALATAAHRPESAADAWQRTLDWFARHLTTGTTESV